MVDSSWMPASLRAGAGVSFRFRTIDEQTVISASLSSMSQSVRANFMNDESETEGI